MAKMFYSAEEAAEKLGRTEEELKGLVREGKLREFRDAGSFNYKVEDVDGLVESSGPAAESEIELDLSGDDGILELEPAAIELSGDSDAGSSGSEIGLSGSDADSSGSDILLEPVEDSGIDLLALEGSDISSFEGSSIGGTASGTSSGTRAAEKAKEDTVVPSVGINVFDDADMDEDVDPLAGTAISDVGGLGIDAASSGSGILDLTRESDDTSLGQELLDEIYTDGEEGGESSASDFAGGLGDSTHAGVDAAISDDVDGADELADAEMDVGSVPETAGKAKATAMSPAAVRQVGEFAPDAVASGLTALLVVAVVVMGFAGLGAASMARGILPSLLETVYASLWIYTAGAAGVALVASGLTYFVRKRSG